MFSHLQQRGVKYFVHFTKLRNVPNILAHGLLSRSELISRGIEHSANDAYRHDHLPNAVCLSVSFPNYKMFYGLRRESPREDWAVIRLRADLVDTKRCVFSPANAATRELAGLPLQTRMTSDALEAMFGDHEGMPLRASLDIPSHFTTNPQAEVLVLDPIEPSYIVDVIVDSSDRINDMGAVLAMVREHNGSKFLHGKKLFDARADYANWRPAPHG